MVFLYTLNQLPEVPDQVTCTLSVKVPSDAWTLAGTVTVGPPKVLNPELPVLKAEILAPPLSAAALTKYQKVVP